MARRRIAVITARAGAAEQWEILRGIAQTAFSADADVVVYSNLYNYWTEDPQLTYENVIYSLFDPAGFDGAIITPEAFRDMAVLDGVVQKLRKEKLPTVVIGGELAGFDSVQSDDGDDMMRMAEHLITVHGLTDMDVLTGEADSPFARMRLDGVRRAMAHHGLPLTDGHIIYGNFWIDSGAALAQEYLSGARRLPQAIICANDHMAYGLCDALIEAGVDIPGRVSITGYDCSGGLSNSRVYHYPLMTSCRRDRFGMGAEAAGMLLGVPRAAEEENRFVPGDSCHCGACRAQVVEELRVERVRRDQAITSSIAQFSSWLTLCRTLAEYTSVLSEFFYLLYGAESLELCLDAAWNSPRYDGRDFLCCRITAEGCSAPVSAGRLVTLPEGALPAAYYVSPVCFQQRLFGVTVLAYSQPAAYEVSFRDFSKTLGDTLEFLRMKNDIHYLTQCQQASTLYDALTGFLNRREFEQQLAEISAPVTLHAVTLRFPAGGEFLFGENYQSEIIAVTAKAIRRAAAQQDLRCRAEEDAFVILCRQEGTAFRQRLQVMLNHALAGRYDERQVLITYETAAAAPSKELLSRLLTAAVQTSERAAATLAERSCLPHYDALTGLRARVYAAPHHAPSLQDAGKHLCVSEGYFRTVYRQCFGVSYQQDCIAARVLKACWLLSETAMSVYAIALECGYEDEKYFARQFRQSIGCAPMEYRKISAGR